MKNTQDGWGLAPSRYSFSDNIKPGMWALKLVSSPVTWSGAGGMIVPAA